MTDRALSICPAYGDLCHCGTPWCPQQRRRVADVRWTKGHPEWAIRRQWKARLRSERRTELQAEWESEA